jgi:pyrimidine and pyridine-specific 5'-nucleotidase
VYGDELESEGREGKGEFGERLVRALKGKGNEFSEKEVRRALKGLGREGRMRL